MLYTKSVQFVDLVPQNCSHDLLDLTYHFKFAQLLGFLLGRASHSFRSPLASMRLAGMQYTGSRSSNPGYPSNDRPSNIQGSRPKSHKEIR